MNAAEAETADPLESVGKDFVQRLNAVVTELLNVWSKIGYTEAQCKEKVERLKQRSYESLQSALQDETQEKNRMWDAIISKLQDISATSSAVNEPCPSIVMINKLHTYTHICTHTHDYS